MTRRIITALALLVLTAAVSVALLHAQGSAEEERPPYRIDLLPGWNLISIPSDPVDMALDSVIGPDSHVSIVLGYQSDAWLTALRNADREWEGTLTTMSGGLGYWVVTPVAETLTVTLSPTPLAQGPPNCYIPRGWQLAGVWDTEQRPAGTKVDADENFRRQRFPWILFWKAAHGFDTGSSQWSSIRPGAGATVEVGAGYWVWATGPALLCP